MKDLPLVTAAEALAINSPWIKSANERAEMTIACKDAKVIPRVPNAGSVKTVKGKKVQIMQNGLMVAYQGYQGEWQSNMVAKLHGIHEPQEEKVFNEVLKKVDKKAIMLELGAWWSYYSMWFLKDKDFSYAYCAEPDPDNLRLGRENTALNGFKEGERVTFIESAAGENDKEIIEFTTESGAQVSVPVRTVDSIVKEFKIPKLDILHMDIQGMELEALRGAIKTIKDKKIRFIFISTHHYTISGDPATHQKCIDLLKSNGAHIIAKHTILESCSGDGLIVASFDVRDADFRVELSLQPSDDSLFRSGEEDTKILWEFHNAYLAEINRLREVNSKLTEEVEDLLQRKVNLSTILQEKTPTKRYIKKRLKSHFYKITKFPKNKKAEK